MRSYKKFSNYKYNFTYERHQSCRTFSSSSLRPTWMKKSQHSANKEKKMNFLWTCSYSMSCKTGSSFATWRKVKMHKNTTSSSLYAVKVISYDKRRKHRNIKLPCLSFLHIICAIRRTCQTATFMFLLIALLCLN